MVQAANYELLTQPERAALRQRYVEAQEWKCWYCKCDIEMPPAEWVRKKKISKALFPKNFFKSHIHLHHDHKTGLTLGAVHSKCNAVLWQYFGE